MYKDILIWTAWYAHDKLNNFTLYKLLVHLLKPFDNLIYGSEVTGVNSCQFEVFSSPSLSPSPLSSSLDLGHFSPLTGIRQAHTHLVSFNGKSFSLNLRLNWFLSLLTTFCLSNDFACVSAIWWVMRVPNSVTLRVCVNRSVCVCVCQSVCVFKVCQSNIWSLLHICVRVSLKSAEVLTKLKVKSLSDKLRKVLCHVG